jgi:hypothetical protein
MDCGNMDAKPTIETEDLTHHNYKEWREMFRTATRLGEYERKKTSRVLRKWRRRQTKTLGYEAEDPDPYSPTYVFFCLEVPSGV